jgi:sugar-specific transcriptional regulator TrmB
MDEIVDKLKELGLNSYEAKVYLALLKKHPATGYEAAKLANIPQARAYDTLKALEAAQIVTASVTKPQTFTPVKPKELTKRCKRKLDATIDYLEKKLPDVKEKYHEPILNVPGFSKIIAKAIEIIKNARHEIYIEIWEQEFKYLESALLDAYNRGLDIKIAGYGDFQSNFGTVFVGPTVADHSFGKRFLFLAADNTECLYGKTEARKDEDVEAIWSKNPDVVYLVKSFIIHDMYLIDIEENFPEQLRYFYGAGLKKLKEKTVTSQHKMQ